MSKLPSNSCADPMRDLLLSARAAQRPIALGVRQSFDWTTFLNDVGRGASWLQSVGASSCLVLAEDCYDFAAGFLAAARAGCRIVLPNNVQPGHVAELAATVDAVIADRAVPDIAASVWRRGELHAGELTALPPAVLETDRIEVVMHTSGSTGAPQIIVRALRTLSAEVATLEACFGEILADGPVLGTVPPYHIYGLLHRILWPLAAGRPIACSTIRFPPDVPVQLADGEAPVCIVASPAFLTRAVPVLNLGSAATAVRAVFSSGGPLPPDVAAQFNNAGIALWEIYGSTETGGIAHRRVFDAAQPPAWTPLPTVNASRDEETGRLIVASPHLCEPGPFLTGDKVSSLGEDGSFFLLGRADRIVKIEERRLSLDELERTLDACPDVDAARFLVLERDGRSTLGAVVVPSELGWARMQRDGRQSFAQHLARLLSDRFAPSAVPRRWRFVRALPVNAQGKVPMAALEALLRGETARPTRPTVVNMACDDAGSSVTLTLEMTPDILYFDGHFEGCPVMPGVAQLDWAVRYGRELLAVPGRFTRLEAVKFFRIISAGATVELLLRHDPASGKLHFDYTSAAGRHSSGRIQFEDAAA